MPFIRRQPPACFDLVDCCDFDLDPLTFISDVDLDMIVLKIRSIGQAVQKLWLDRKNMKLDLDMVVTLLARYKLGQ